MRAYRLTHLSDGQLMQALNELVARDRRITAELLAHIAEVDDRRLYVPAGYPSMYEYCVRELRLSPQAAFKRIGVGRVGRRVPEVLDAIADGRLHLSGALMLTRHLTSGNARELIEAASNRTVAEIELMLATRFPKADVPESITPVGQDVQLSSKIVAGSPAGGTGAATAPAGGELSSKIVAGVPSKAAGAPTATRPPYPRVKPLAPERFALQVTIPGSTRDKLERARQLLSHTLPSRDLAQVLDLALDALVEKLEKRRFAATKKPRTKRSGTAPRNPRTIPARVKREVAARDGGRCTFVSATGHRCESRSFLEYDHVRPVGKGGTSTVANVRLRCRAHNQHAAECSYGAGFMHRTRERARRGVENRRTRANAPLESSRTPTPEDTASPPPLAAP